METGEESLVAAARRGDLQAFNRLVERYQQPVYNLCLRMLASTHAAEDATQEAFLSAYRRLDSFRDGSFRAWLFRIAANACYDELRRRRSRPALSLDAGEGERPVVVPAAPGPALDEIMENLELGRHLQEALLSLQPDQRLAVILRDVQGFDYEEIVRITNTSLGTVKSRISRGRLRLRELLRPHRELFSAAFRSSTEEI